MGAVSLSAAHKFPRDQPADLLAHRETAQAGLRRKLDRGFALGQLRFTFVPIGFAGLSTALRLVLIGFFAFTLRWLCISRLGALLDVSTLPGLVATTWRTWLRCVPAYT